MKGNGFFSRKKQDMQKTGKLLNNFRFIDDLCFFNNGQFENNSNDIYPDVLELKKENKVHDRKFTTKL